MTSTAIPCVATPSTLFTSQWTTSALMKQLSGRPFCSGSSCMPVLCHHKAQTQQWQWTHIQLCSQKNINVYVKITPLWLLRGMFDGFQDLLKCWRRGQRNGSWRRLPTVKRSGTAGYSHGSSVLISFISIYSCGAQTQCIDYIQTHC